MRLKREDPYHVTLEITNKQCKVLRMLREAGVQRFRVADIRSTVDGSTRHLVRMPTKQLSRIPESLFTVQSKNGKLEREISGWFNSEGCEVCGTILSKGSFLISGRNVKDNTLVYTFIAPSLDAFKEIISIFDDKGLKPKILEAGKLTHKTKILTENQERVLWLALKMGYFDYPKKINSAELSNRLQIRASTLSETTRRGMRRLLKQHFET